MLFVFALSAFVQISFWILVWIGFERARRKRYSATPTSAGVPPVSVVVAVRNEADALPALLDALKQQRHPEFEIIFVDDGSTDRTNEVLNRRSANDIRISVIENPPEHRGKKGAVREGISAAKHKLVAMTDADCRPGPEWLPAVAAAHGSGAPCILVGYGPLAQRPGFLNALIRFETVTTAIMTAASIGLGAPYMAVGRNLSYPKSVVSSVADRRSGANLLSGDDDLFVQDAARARVPVRHLFDPATFVVSDPPETSASWIRQKRRHISASRAYRPAAKLILGAFHASAVMCWVAPIVIGWPGLACLAAKLATQWPVTATGASHFRERGLIGRLPALDIGLILFLLIAGPAGLFFPPRKW